MDRSLWMAYLRSLALATEVTQEIFAMFKYACISWLVNGTLKIHFVRESHVGMLTQHEVFLQAGVQV